MDIVIINLSTSIFWDIDINSLDYEKHARFIISRVLMRGTYEDWNEIKKYYGIERIKNEIVNVRYLDKLTLNFCCIYFDIPIEKFRCYNIEPSIRKLWNY